MAMEADERELLLDTIEALGVLTFALGATFAGLKQEVTNLKPRLLVALNTAATNAPAVAARGDVKQMLAKATALIQAI